jgi:D-alanine--poly(phosphoribitol) ligase subunit 2
MNEKLLDILATACETDLVKTDTSINLFDNSLLDSIGVIQLLLAIESELGIVVDPIDLQREDIETPEKFVAYFSKLQ